MTDHHVIQRYEECPACTDGSCGECGTASSMHASPGVRVVKRSIRFVVCTNGHNEGVPKPCGVCGPGHHPLAAPGITTEVIGERHTRRWVPAVHMKHPLDTGKGKCGTSAPAIRLTTDWEAVTCIHCKKMKGKR